MANNKVDNVDTRVVEMQFDNKQFEKGADKTLTTLEKLKNALKFENANKGFDSLQKSINSVSLDGLTKQVVGVESAFNTLAGSLKKNFFDKMSNEILSLGAQLYRATAGQIVSGGKTRAMNIAQAKFKMEGMNVSWDQIKDDLDYAVSGTAYGLDAAASIASQLVASGVEVGDSMKKALRGVSGVAAMTSSSYEEIGQVFAAVAGQGKAMAMQLNQLSLRGINAASTIAQYLGVTEAEVRELASQGKISFEIFSEAMDEAFGEHAKEANKTFTGAASNIRAALSKIGELFWSPFYESAIKPLNIIRETIVMFKNGLTGALEDVDTKFGLRTTAERLQQIVKVIGDIASLLLTGIQRGLKRALKYLQPVNRVMISWLHNLKEVRSWLQSIVPSSIEDDLNKVQTGIEGITEAEIQMAKDVWYKGAYGTGADRVMALGEHYKVVQAYIDNFINSNYKWADSVEKTEQTNKKAAESTGKVSEILSNLLYNLKTIVWTIQNWVWPAVKNIVTFVSSVAKTALESFFDLFFKYDPNDLRVINIFEQFGYLIYRLGEVFTLTEKDTENLWHTFDGFFSLVSIGSNLITEILNRIAPLFGEFKRGDSALLHITSTIGKFISSVHNVLVTEGGIHEFFEIMTESAESFIEKIDSLLGISIIEWFEALKKAIKDVGRVFEDKGIKGGFKYIKDNLKSIINIDSSKIGEVITKIFGFVKNLVFGSSTLLGTISDTFKEFFNLVKSVIQKVRKFITEDVGEFISMLNSSSKNGVGDGFVNSIFNLVDSMTNLINGLADRLDEQDVERLQESLGKTNEATNSVVSFIKTSAKDIEGADSSVDSIVNTVQAISNSIIGLIASIGWYKLADGIQGIGKGIKATGKALNVAVGSLDTIFKPLAKAEAFKRITEGLKNLVSSVIMLGAAILVFALVIHFCDISWQEVLTASLAMIGSLIAVTVSMAVLSKVATVRSVPAIIGMSMALALMLGEVILLTLLFYKFSDSEEHMKTFLDALRNAIVTVGIITAMILSMFSAFTALTIAMTSTSNSLLSDDISDSIKAVGSVILDMAKAIVILLVAVLVTVWMFNKYDENYVFKAFLTISAFVYLTAVAFMGIAYATMSLANSYSATTLAKLSDLLKSISSFIKVIVGSIVILFAAAVLALNLGAGEEFMVALGLMVTILGSVTGVIWAISQSISGDGVTAEKLESVSKIVNAMWKFIASVSISLMGMAIVAKKFGSANMWSSLVMLVGGSLALIAGFAAILGGTSQKDDYGAGYSKFTSIFGGLFKSQKDFKGNATKAKGISKNAIQLVKTLSIFVLAVAGSISAIAIVTKLVGGENMAQAFATLAGTIFSILLLTYMIIQSAKIDTEKLKSVSILFVAIGAAVLAISGGLAILATAINAIDSEEMVETVIGALASVVSIIAMMSLVTIAISKLDFKDAKNLALAMAGLAAAFIGLAAVIAAVAAMVHAVSKGPDPKAVSDSLESITIILFVMSAAIVALTALGKDDIKSVIAAGAGLGIAFIALATALLAVGYILKIVEDYDLSVDILYGLSAMIGAMGTIIVAIDAVSGLIGPMSLLGLATLGGGLLEIGAFLFALTKLEWDKIKNALEILTTYEDTLKNILLILVAMIGLSTVSGLSATGLISFAIGIAAVAAALMLLAKAVYMLQKASMGEDPWKSNDFLESTKNYVDSSESIAESGKKTGEAFAEGVEDGITDHQADIEEAGANAGKALANGTEGELGINSPSKVGYQIGEFFGEGIENALEDQEDPLARKAAMLGKAMSNSLSNEIDTFEISEQAANDLTDHIANDMPNVFDNQSVQDSWGDFAFESYGDHFDDAPVIAEITPVVDSDNMEAEIKTDPMSSFQDTLGGLLTNTDSISGSMDSLTGEGGWFDDIKEQLSGIFNEDGSLNFGLDDIITDEKIAGITDEIPSVTDLSNGFHDVIGQIQIPDLNSMAGFNVFGKLDEWLGKGGVNGGIQSIIEIMLGGDKDSTVVKAFRGELFTGGIDETDGGNNIGVYSADQGWTRKYQDPWGNWYEYESGKYIPQPGDPGYDPALR